MTDNDSDSYIDTDKTKNDDNDKQTTWETIRAWSLIILLVMLLVGFVIFLAYGDTIGQIYSNLIDAASEGSFWQNVDSQ